MKKIVSIVCIVMLAFSTLSITTYADDSTLPNPTIDPITSGDTTISGIGYPDFIIIVLFPNGAAKSTTVDSSGHWSMEVPNEISLLANDSVTVRQTVRSDLKTSFVTYRGNEQYWQLQVKLSNEGHPLSVIEKINFSYHFPMKNYEFVPGSLKINGQVCDSNFYTYEEKNDSAYIRFSVDNLALYGGMSTSNDYISIEVSPKEGAISTTWGLQTSQAPYPYTETVATVASTVSYNANGAKSGNVPTDNNTYFAGDPITLMGNTGVLKKEGYTFSGWTLDENGSGAVYMPDATLASNGLDITLYAKWTKILDTSNPSDSTTQNINDNTPNSPNPSKSANPKTGDNDVVLRTNLLYASLALIGISFTMFFSSRKKKNI